ncbi:MAG TPA: hydrogenase maturation protease [Solirubrobacteraceae bacterium]|nr:hydrogenase maturation protease [Solirubrobacteraceae bacterium]
MVGVGNAWRGDDAAGLEVVHRVRELAAGLSVATLEGDASALVELWSGHDDVALVDAARSGARPGTLHELSPGDRSLPAAALRSSTHAFGVIEAVSLASALDRLPARLEIFAVEGEDFALGAALSPAVARTVDALAVRLARRGAAP